MMMAWWIARTVGLRAASGLLGAWLDPAGRVAILAVALAVGGVGMRAWWIEQGRDEVRAANAALVRQAEAAADAEREVAARENAEAAARDAAELAAIEARERQVREEQARRDAEARGAAVSAAPAGKAPPADLLWPAGDGWLRSKRGG